MKKSILTILGLLLLGTTNSVVAEGNVVIKDVVNDTTIKNSDIRNSSVGMSVSANGGNVRIEKNVNINRVKNSTIQNSLVGIHARGEDGVEIKNNINIADIENSVLDGVNVGISDSTSNKLINNEIDDMDSD